MALTLNLKKQTYHRVLSPEVLAKIAAKKRLNQPDVTISTTTTGTKVTISQVVFETLGLLTNSASSDGKYFVTIEGNGGTMFRGVKLKEGQSKSRTVSNANWILELQEIEMLPKDLVEGETYKFDLVKNEEEVTNENEETGALKILAVYELVASTKKGEASEKDETLSKEEIEAAEKEGEEGDTSGEDAPVVAEAPATVTATKPITDDGFGA